MSDDPAHAEVLASPMIKPVCGACNLVCTYCYYRQTKDHFEGTAPRMTDETLRNVVRTFCQTAHPCPHFSWQGGEPMLAGLDFFQKAVAYQQAFSRQGQQIVNAFQTNGTLITAEWARFLNRWGMLVGISVDGPTDIHDKNRIYPNGSGSQAEVLRGLRLLQEYKVEHNVLVLVHGDNVRRPKEVIEFIRGLGEDYLQFIPCVVTGLDRSLPSHDAVDPIAYGEFLCAVFDEWIAEGPHRFYVRMFNNLVMAAAGLEPEYCVFRRACAGCLLVEHNADVFPCDFLVQPEWRLGNLNTDSLAQIYRHPKWVEFRRLKPNPPEACRQCRHLDLCHGGCPRDRFGGRLPGGEPNYLCKGYQLLFDHARPAIDRIAAEWLASRRQPPPREQSVGRTERAHKPRRRPRARKKR
ncbi:MAG: anaerobic sulfatase maturase [Phycisphaerae bacterium]|nr:anaerobic sulfatase maturase [Phycisphaerae bacterium]